MGAYNCPSDNGTIYSPSITKSYTFQILCNIDWYGVAISGNANLVDIQTVLATSIDACIDSCAAQRFSGGNCSAVSYGANITLALSRGGVPGNCFLKDQRGLVDRKDTSGQEIAAYLIDS
jgi:hypothetical protein